MLEQTNEIVRRVNRLAGATVLPDRACVMDVLRVGNERANVITEAVLRDVRGAFALEV